MPLRLFLSKSLKVILIKCGFIIPTLKAKFLLSWYGCSFGRCLRACGVIHIRANTIGSIKIGSHINLTARFLTNTVGLSQPLLLETIAEGKIEIGSYSGLSSSILSARNSILIGKHVNIGGNVRIYDHDFHSTNAQHRRDSRLDGEYTACSPIVIEDDVFIGANAFILKGVHIGARSVIGAGSVVLKGAIPPDSIVAGNPARVIKPQLKKDV